MVQLPHKGVSELINFILLLHQYNPYLIVTAAAISGIWGLIIYFTRRPPLVKPWRIMLIITVALGILQGLFGLIMVFASLKPGGGKNLYYLHYVYGGIVALGLPLTWLSFTTNGKDQRKDLLIYSIAALVLVAAAIRAWMTGPA
jgi:heme A synthase